jgi:autotransporter adhesin
MIVDLQLLNAIGITRTHDTVADSLKFFESLNDPTNLKLVQQTLAQNSYPFYRWFSNYGTGIGETIEEVIGIKFINNVVPKMIAPTSKRLKSGKIKEYKPKKNPAYAEYNKANSKKPSNYDWLAIIKNELSCVEVKVIRATESKPNQGSKIFELPSLLEERALPYAERDKSGNQTFQQTKPDMFDYLLGVTIYADQVDFYLVPSVDIKSGKLKITNQHAGAINDDGGTNEGHLAVGTLDEYIFLTVKTEEELLASDDLNKYIK